MKAKLLNIDCVEYMKTLPDKYFHLAVVDPPYGIGEDGGKRRQKKNRPNSYHAELKHKKKAWDSNSPDAEYFKELFRVSKHQIIWGANFYISKMPYDSSCWIVWDKNIGGDQADCELAWTSFKTAIRKFFGHPFIGTNGGKDRIHPTQKPIALYKWLYENYTKPGWRILDTHLGSGSSAIVAEKMGFEFVGCEIDEEYFEAAVARFNEATDLGIFQMAAIADKGSVGKNTNTLF
jgi:site-specific DNA-methyltransferase (adenine-specific)